jgi:hypothetical protein
MHMARNPWLTAFLLVALPPSAAHAQQAIVVDDAHVSAQRPNRSFGDADTLQLSPVERALVRFSLDLPAGTPGAHVGQATLKVFVRNVRTPGAIRLHRVAGPWSEAEVTYGTSPAIGAQEGAPVLVTPAHQHGWVTLDATQLVRDWLNNAVVNDGVALVGVGATDVALDSKENVATSHEPVLEIRLNHAATADDATRLGGMEAAGYVQTNDFRLTNDRPPLPGSHHYVQNTPNAQDAQFNVGSGIVRGNLTVLGALNAPSLNVSGSFIQNQTTQPQPGAGFNVAGDGTVGGILSGGTVNAATAFNIGGQRVLGIGAAGSSNVFLGQTAGLINAGGTLNTFVGFGAGASNGDGCCNSFFGNFAGNSNTTGFANVFVGGGAGGTHKDGFRNTLLGDLAGNDLFEGTGLITGNRNTFVGSVSGRRIATGSSNTFVGVDTTGTPDIQFASAFGSNATVTTNDTIVIGKAAGTYYGVERPADTVVIPGSLNVAGTLSLNIVNAGTQFDISGQRVLVADPALNVALGFLAGAGAGGANTSIGYQAGQSASGRANVFLGNRSGRFAAGNSNTFVGSIAGEAHASGDENTFVGDGAGGSLTGGSENSFFGVDAGRGKAGSAPNRNSFFGTLAGTNSHSDFANAAFGFRAGFANEAGTSNAFFGAWAGENTTASYNAFFGTQAGQGNIAGVRNAFFGTEAGSHNVDGYENVFVGALAGVSNASGVWNTFVGTSAGFTNQGSHNSFFGTNAGRANTTGNHNSFFGRAAGYSSTADRNAFFGAGAGELTTTGGDNAFLGTGAGSMNVTGTDNTFVGANVGRNNSAGSHNTLLGSHAEVGAGDLSFATALGAGAVVDASNTVVLGRAADMVRIPGRLSIAGGQVLKSLNALTDDVTLAAGSNITITPTGNTLTIAAAGGGAVNAILNQTTVQGGASFNIDGGGTASAFNAAQYQVDGARVLSTPGSENTFVGAGTGAANTGFRNTFVGGSAGLANTSGHSNAFFGTWSGFSNQIGWRNSFFGASAGSSNVHGVENAFFGMSAGSSNQTGNNNAIFGALAGLRNNGNGNSLFGYRAGFFNETGDFNSVFGFSAGESLSGPGNTFIGAWAGAGVFGTGGYNTGVGFQAGFAHASSGGSYNTAIGYNAQATVGGFSNTTAVGAHALVLQNDSLVLGSINGVNGATSDTQVGIGTSTPKARLDVRGGDVLVGSPGQGILLKSPNGSTCLKLTVSDAGALTQEIVACPL